MDGWMDGRTEGALEERPAQQGVQADARGLDTREAHVHPEPCIPPRSQTWASQDQGQGVGAQWVSKKSHLEEVSDQVAQTHSLHPRLPPRYITMRLLSPWLLLLGKDCGLGWCLGSGVTVGLGEEERSGAEKSKCGVGEGQAVGTCICAAFFVCVCVSLSLQRGFFTPLKALHAPQ